MKQGYRVMDSDLHTMEPDDLWARYLDEPYRRFAPTFARGAANAPNQPVIRVGGLEIAEMAKRPRTAVVGQDLHRRAFARHPHYEVAFARGYDAESHVAAMDIEGIDVAVLYGTRGRQVLMHDELEPALAAALARAHNNWTRDYCDHAPERLKFAAQVAFHDPARAVVEARRAVRELGAVAVVGNPNPIAGRHIHDPQFEPLWDAIEELGVPVGFHPTGQSSLRDDIARRYLDQPNGRVIGVAGRNPTTRRATTTFPGCAPTSSPTRRATSPGSRSRATTTCSPSSSRANRAPSSRRERSTPRGRFPASRPPP